VQEEDAGGEDGTALHAGEAITPTLESGSKVL
jgi:hypothetical protein